MSEKMIVSKPMAKLFMDLCMGESSGHMAMIPNNPVLFAMCKSHNIYDEDDFSRFLRMVANQLGVSDG